MEKHIPLRMCVACRSMKPKKELIRIVFDGKSIKADEAGKMQCRGAYVCRNEKCVELMKKKKAVERTFHTQCDADTYNMIKGMLE